MNPHSFVSLKLLLPLLVMAHAALGKAEVRAFTDTSGRIVRGELEAVVGDFVTIKREDGQAFSMRKSNFCPADVAYFDQHTGKAAPEPAKKTPAAGKADVEPLDFKDIVVSGSGFTIETLDNKVVAFSNRNYVWEKVPESLRGRKYTKIGGGQRPKIVVKAKRNTILQAITDNDHGGDFMAGWEKKPFHFVYNSHINANMVLVERKLDAGSEIEITQGNWAGVLLLLPKD